MQTIKRIVFQGELDVWGVFNYNQLQTRERNKNHIVAKKFKFIDENGTREVDYTSSRCLRHEIFKDIQPRQPSRRTFADQFVKMAASEVGLLRGFLFPEGQLKRSSPLHIADAQTIDDISLVYDQGSSSKPKEKREEEDKSDTTLFSKENAPYRKQKLLGGINLKELQFLSLYDDDSDFAMINENDQDEFKEQLMQYFRDRNVSNDIEIKKYIDIDSIYKSPRNGILLNQEQLKHLVKVVFQRIRMINGLKAGSRIAYKKGSLNVSFFDGLESHSIEEKDLHKKLKDVAFHHFFQSTT